MFNFWPISAYYLFFYCTEYASGPLPSISVSTPGPAPAPPDMPTAAPTTSDTVTPLPPS
jgi:hypothetical protein